MNTIKLKINYDGDVKLNGETKVAPLEMFWFAGVDLNISTVSEDVIFNSNRFLVGADGVYKVDLKPRDKKLEIVDGANIKLFKSGDGAYLVVNDKYAYKLPRSILEIV